MRMRDVGRIAFSFALVGGTIITAASCGGSGSATSGGDASVDGSSFHITSDAGGNRCTVGTCASLGFTCGDNADGCGGLLHCGTCNSPDFCGGGGFSKCGPPSGPDGGPIVPCTPKTCTDFPQGTCGQQSDGCGMLTANCGADDAGVQCPIGQFCGGGGPSLCGTGTSGDAGDAGTCTPKACADYASGTCGKQSDGCGNLTANCSTCVNPQYCGGGSTPGTCGGNNGLGPDGGPIVPPCVPKTCADYPAGTCGIQATGCGGTIGPCTTCAAPSYCGGGGPSLCGGDAGAGSSSGGGGPDAGGTCTPQTCANYPTGTCGQQSDGCGGLTANCGTCTSPAFCGGGGAGKCGGNNGRNPDGSVISTCTPATCASKGYNCGQAGDGCGGIMGPCGPACTAPQACGAGGQANVCGSNLPCTGLCTQQAKCDGGGTTTLKGTVVAGTIATYLPAGVANGDPVPNVLVYVPNSAVLPFTPRSGETQAQQCSVCGADVSGNPLVLTKTAYDGTFTLQNVPVGATIPIVIQLGRWRRQFTVNVATSCGQNTVNAAGMPAGILRMPRTQAEGDIPLTAISTGDVDALECVLLKMGIDSTEFTLNSTTVPKNGRVHVYQGNGATSSLGATPNEPALMGATGTYNNYDQVVLPCWGVDPTTANSVNAKPAGELANLVTYGNNGGHFFATHFSYAWLYNNNPYSTTAAWNVNHNTGINSMTGVVSQTVPPTTPVTNPGVFVEWLNYIHALSNFTAAPPPPNPADVTIANARHDVDNVLLQSVDWIDGTDPGDQSQMLLHYTFDTPVGQAAQCGHSIFSDFHVSNSATGADACQANTDCPSGTCQFLNATCANNAACGAAGRCAGNGHCNRGTCIAAQFPSQSNAYCGTTPMTAQEKILEYMIWDLSSCVPGQPTSTCTPKTCASFPAGTCGQQGDGCGGLTPDCNPCPAGQACGACGTPGVCCAPDGGACVAKTCTDYPNACGQQSDGCGGLTANCTCPAGQTCGGGGVAGQCGSGGSSSGGPTCTPKTCADYPAGTCGQQADGCGNLTVDCSPCPMGQTCGGCGVPGQCCTPPSSSCTPQPCPSSVMCGPASDGCGGIIASCGTCTPPQTCGGGGTPGQCGGTSGCQPLSCADQHISCGPAGDGCGNLIAAVCGVCTPPQTCGGGGTPGVCGGGGVCQPKTCQDLGVACGPTGDGCGNLIPSCGTCAPPDTCGGGGKPGQCGSPIAQ
jgi:hypothetical protein